MRKDVWFHYGKETLPLMLQMCEKMGSDSLLDVVLPRTTELLRQLKANDAPQYSKYSEQIAKLAYLHLTRKRNGSTEIRLFAYAALQALQQIGTKNALPFVEKIAALDTKYYNAKNVILAAQECLPFLHQRAENQYAEQTLLRAAESKTSSDMLLRPAAETETSSGELLRAMNEI